MFPLLIVIIVFYYFISVPIFYNEIHSEGKGKVKQTPPLVY